jgi:glycosyltransferase involved in cell wall biosynthesis
MEDMNRITFSVVIPFFRNKKHLENIIILLKFQTRSVDEIIIVDDASNESIQDIVKKYNVTYFRMNRNSGVSIARNKGLELSKSDVTIFIDGDAYPELTMIDAFFDMYSKYWGDFVGIGGRAIECRILSKYDSWRARHLSQDYGDFEKINVPYLFGVCCSYKTDFLENFKGFDSFFTMNVGEDYDLGIRLNKKNFKLAYSPNIVVNHQRFDTEESLQRSQYFWSYWELLIHKRNGISTLRPWLGHLRKIVIYSLSDFLSNLGNEFVCIGIKTFFCKFKGLADAYKIQTKTR